MRNSRLIGGKPKIGIRPIIDGRRGGIRESLEDMTMAMAHKVAELYSSVLRHSDGTPIECVIADTTIGGVAEAAMAAEKFRNNGVGVVLSVTPCWCYGFETIDMDGEMPKAIWGFNGTERPGAVYLASALAGHTQKEHSIAYRVTKDEALDLPEQTFLQRYITMSAKEKNIYDRIKRESFAELESGGQISATTVLTKLLRLQQFTGGFLVADGEEKPELVSKSKLNALEEIVDDYVVNAGKKLVIFARFRPEIDIIGQMLKKKKLRYGEIYGDVKLEDRGDIVKDFQTNPETMVFLAQIDTAGLGITLTAADTCVYYSVNFNYAAYSQSLARIHRIGQKNACTYIHLITEGTIDEVVLKALAKKEDLAKTVVDTWRDYF